MESGDACVADLLDSVHYEMNGMVRSHHVYKSVQSPVITEQLILKKEPICQSTGRICSGNDKGLLDTGQHSVGKVFTDDMVFYCMKRQTAECY